MPELLPISAIIPTRNRSKPLLRTLESLAGQSLLPMEMIVIDGSTDEKTRELCYSSIPGLVTEIKYFRAIEIGAATQRNQGMLYATQDVIWLMDDDILLEPGCLSKLWSALNSSPELGGVNAMIRNQNYSPPGIISRCVFKILHGRSEKSYAGMCIGPGLNLLPEDNPFLPEIVQVEWLNSTCTLYRREALPNPLFPENFTGYSLMEDLSLSLTISKNWKLANARTARIFHDSQPGDHKNDPAILAKMSLINRHYVMTSVLHRDRFYDYLKLGLLQLFEVAALCRTLSGIQTIPAVLSGKYSALLHIFSPRSSYK